MSKLTGEQRRRLKALMARERAMKKREREEQRRRKAALLQRERAYRRNTGRGG